MTQYKVMARLWFPLVLTIALVFAVTGEFWFALRFLAVCWLPSISVCATRWCIVRGDMWQKIGGTIFGLLLLACVWLILPGAGLVVFKYNISGLTLALVSAVVGCRNYGKVKLGECSRLQTQGTGRIMPL